MFFKYFFISLKQYQASNTPRGASTPKLPSPQTDASKPIVAEPPQQQEQQKTEQPQADEVSSTVSNSVPSAIDTAETNDLITIETTATIVEVTSTTPLVDVDSSESSSHTENEPTVVTNEIKTTTTTITTVSKPETDAPLNGDVVPVVEVGRPVEIENNEMTGISLNPIAFIILKLISDFIVF